MAVQLPQRFAAHGFHPELPHGRSTGSLTCEPGYLSFVPDDHNTTGDGHVPFAAAPPEAPFAARASAPLIELPLAGLELRLGGANDRLLFLSHPARPDQSLYTNELAILDQLAAGGDAAVAASVAAIRGKVRRGRTVGVALLVAVCAVLAGLVLLKDPLVGLVARVVPASVEVKLGELVFRQVKGGMELMHDEALTADLEGLVAPLVAALPETPYPLTFHLADDGEINALAVPGGHVVINSGLVLAAERPEEVLGVLAHEIAHVTERHSLRQIISTVGVYVLVQTLLGDLSGIAAVVADGGLQLATLGFSRSQESDADRVGLAMLVRADIDPSGMVDFFTILEREQREKSGDLAQVEQALAFLGTHPRTAERIADLEREIAEMSSRSFPVQTFDLASFQARIRAQSGALESVGEAEAAP